MKRKLSILIFLFAGMTAVMAQTETNPQDSILKSLLIDEVEVVAQKPLIKMDTDKLTYDVSQDPDAKAATILDMLRKVPMVTVDGQDNITVNGSSAFKIYVDGKPNIMFSSNPSQIFKAMPATLVKSIEVVTNPGAKYDAEGTGGVLDIKLNHDGIAGMLSGNTPMESINGINGNIRLQGGNRGYGGSAFVSGQQDKLSFSVNAMLNQMKMAGTEVTMTQEQFGPLPSTTLMHQQGGDTRTPFGMANVSLGYELDALSSINASLGFTTFNMSNSGSVYNKMSGGFYADGFEYNMFNDLDNKRSGLNVSADYQRFLNKERTSSFAVTYLFARNPSSSQNSSEYDHSISLPEGFENFLNDRFSDNKEHSTEHTLQFDFTTPITVGHALNLGAKLTSHSSESASDFYYGPADDRVLQPSLCSDYSNLKSILAGYAEYEGKFGKIGTRAGMRYEHTWQSVEYVKGNGDDFDNNYGNLIPSLSLSYALAPIANVGLTYNLRISRPGISYLNPYVDRSNNTALTYGNPDLDVEKSHNVGLVLNAFTPMLMFNLNLRYALTDGAIDRYSFYRDNILHTTYGNIVKRQTTSLTLFASYLLHKNTRLFTNAGLSYADLSSNKLAMSNSGWQYNLMLGLQQTLPLDIKLAGYLISNSKTFTLQGSNTGFNMLSANLSKSFLHEKLTVSLQAMTGLNKGGKLVMETHSAGTDFASTSHINVPISNVTLSLAYNFGNAKVKARRHESKVKSDVIERTSEMEQLNNSMNLQQQ